MSISPKSPPETPIRSNTPIQNGSSIAPQEDVDKTLPNGETADTAMSGTSEPSINQDSPEVSSPPTQPGIEGEAPQPEPEAVPGQNVPAFDWAEFEQRYAETNKAADAQESELLAQFDELVDFFGHWATAASRHDDDRAIKRLKTRESYVQNKEAVLEKKKQHFIRVVDAFQQAIALLE